MNTFFQKLILLLVLSLFFTISGFAEPNSQEYAKCAIIKGDLARLECYDNLVKDKKLHGMQTQSTSIKDKGKWQVAVETNPIDDTKQITLLLKADSGENSWGEPVYLVVRCKSNKTDFHIHWREYLGLKNIPVLTRIGKNKAQTEHWSLSTDNQSTFYFKAIPFLKEMLTSNSLIAQVTPYNSNPITAIFDTTGLNNAIKPLRKTCNWQ